MKVEFTPRRLSVRGEPVVVGNVYCNNTPPAHRDFRLVVGVNDGSNGRRAPWNKVIFVHLDAMGNVVGSSCQPHEYVKNRWDLIGRCKNMPKLKIEWIDPETSARKRGERG